MKRRLLYANILLYVGIAILATLHWRELNWAFDALPLYLDGSIKTPEEHTLYREAERNLGEEDWKLPYACEAAEKSLAIDPNCEAGFWLARCLFESGKKDGAVEWFRRFSEIDPVKVESYLTQSVIHVQRQEYEEARAALERGAEYFDANFEAYRAVIDPSVNDRYNEKAEWVAEYYRLAARTLEREIERVDAAAAAVGLPD